MYIWRAKDTRTSKDWEGIGANPMPCATSILPSVSQS